MHSHEGKHESGKNPPTKVGTFPGRRGTKPMPVYENAFWKPA